VGDGVSRLRHDVVPVVWCEVVHSWYNAVHMVWWAWCGVNRVPWHGALCCAAYDTVRWDREAWDEDGD
jgi:hypothetical protein